MKLIDRACHQLLRRPPPTPPRPSPEEHNNASLPFRIQDEDGSTDYYKMSMYYLYQNWKLTGQMQELNLVCQTKDSKLKEIDSQLQQRDSQILELNEKVKRKTEEILELNEKDNQKTKEILELKEKVKKRTAERDYEARANSVFRKNTDYYKKEREHCRRDRDYYQKERDELQAQVVKLQLEIQSRPHKDRTDSSTIVKKHSKDSSDKLKEDKSMVMKRSLEQDDEEQSKRLRLDSESLISKMVSVKSELFLGQESQESVLSEENENPQPQVGGFKFLDLLGSRSTCQ